MRRRRNVKRIKKILTSLIAVVLVLSVVFQGKRSILPIEASEGWGELQSSSVITSEDDPEWERAASETEPIPEEWEGFVSDELAGFVSEIPFQGKDPEVRRNAVTFVVGEGVHAFVEGVDVTREIPRARDGKIVFDTVVEDGYRITAVLVDGSIPARENPETEETEEGSVDYIIEGIQTDDTIVEIRTEKIPVPEMPEASEVIEVPEETPEEIQEEIQEEIPAEEQETDVEEPEQVPEESVKPDEASETEKTPETDEAEDPENADAAESFEDMKDEDAESIESTEGIESIEGIEETIRTLEINGTKVIVTYPAAAFEEPVTLEGEEISRDVNITPAEESESGREETSYRIVHDIRFTDPEGREVEPKEGYPVQVSMEYQFLNVTEEIIDLKVVHTPDEGDEEIVFHEENAEIPMETPRAEFELSSFSYVTSEILTYSRPSTTMAMKIADTSTLRFSGPDQSNGNSYRYHRWVSSDNEVISLSNANQSSVTVTAERLGNGITVRYQGRDMNYGTWNTIATWTINVNEVKIYVYVAAYDTNGALYSDEMLSLLGIDRATLDNNHYFPAGEIILDGSYFDGKTGVYTPGHALINTDADWSNLVDALSDMNTNTLIDQGGKPYSRNRGNHVNDYLSQAAADKNYSWGSQHTALFRWNDSTSYGFQDQTIKYHLDLRFETKKITFITGRNGITNQPGANDFTTVDSRVYIKGSPIQEPRNVSIPPGYRFVGYYEDADFRRPWNGIGTPLNEDEVVYLKITPIDNVIIYYKVAEGEGTVTPDSEGLNPVTGVAAGSTAAPAAGYELEGWYADENCTQRVGNDSAYIPAKPQGSDWVETTYWAKFIPKKVKVQISKTVAGNMGDREKEFYFDYIIGNSDEPNLTEGSFQLKHGETSAEIEVEYGQTITIVEAGGDGYAVSIQAPPGLGTANEADGTYSLEVNESVLNEAALNEGKVMAAYTNTREIAPPMGVTFNSGTPWFILLMLAMLLTAGYLSIKLGRRRIDGR